MSNMKYGWICPICHKVNAPHIDSCNCSNQYTYVPYANPYPYDWRGPVYSTGKYTTTNTDGQTTTTIYNTTENDKN